MSDVTRMLDRAQAGDPKAAEELLPLVYEELRKLAAHKMANEAAGHTLQPTALVHEAWLRVAGSGQRYWNSRGHFFAAAAEAMRRILIEIVRRKQSQQRGGQWQRIELDESALVLERPAAEVLNVDAALEKLAREDPLADRFRHTPRGQSRRSAFESQQGSPFTSNRPKQMLSARSV